jgi:hypothetical protein
MPVISGGSGLPSTGGTLTGPLTINDSAGLTVQNPSVPAEKTLVQSGQVRVTADGYSITAEQTSHALTQQLNTDGTLTNVHSAPPDGDLVAGDCYLWYDQTNGAAKLMVKAKQADGTVKTGSVNLA